MQFDLKTELHRYNRYFISNVQKLYEKKEVRLYTELILSLFAIAFFGVFALKPTLVTIASLYNELNTKKEIDRQLQIKINTLASAQTNLALIENDLPLLDEALPKELSLAEFLYQIESLIQKNGVAVRSITIQPVTIFGEKPKELALINFSLSVSGSFENLNNFLSSLENLRRIVIINSSSYTQTKTSENTIELNLNITGSTHWLSEQK